MQISKLRESDARKNTALKCLYIKSPFKIIIDFDYDIKPEIREMKKFVKLFHQLLHFFYKLFFFLATNWFHEFLELFLRILEHTVLIYTYLLCNLPSQYDIRIKDEKIREQEQLHV